MGGPMRSAAAPGIAPLPKWSCSLSHQPARGLELVLHPDVFLAPEDRPAQGETAAGTAGAAGSTRVLLRDPQLVRQVGALQTHFEVFAYVGHYTRIESLI